jgi:hypothetical protein
MQTCQLAHLTLVKLGAGITCLCYGIDTRVLQGYLGTDFYWIRFQGRFIIPSNRPHGRC